MKELVTIRIDFNEIQDRKTIEKTMKLKPEVVFCLFFVLLLVLKLGIERKLKF